MGIFNGKSSLLRLRFCLFLLLPACLSLNSLATEEKDKTLEWLQFWILLALVLLIENLLDSMIGRFGLLFNTLFIVWCLPLVPFSGNKLVFYVFIPLHDFVGTTLHDIPDFFLHELLYPIFVTFSDVGNSIFINFPKYANKVCKGLLSAVSQLLENIYVLLINFPQKMAELYIIELMQNVSMNTYQSFNNMWPMNERKCESANWLMDLKNWMVGTRKEERLFSDMLRHLLTRRSEEASLISHIFQKFTGK